MTNLNKYIDSNGLLSPDGNCSGNGVLYTSEYLMMRWDQNLSASLCNVANKMPLMRSPTNTDQESFDDYIGLVSCSPMFASAVLEYGRRNFWVFKNNPSASFKKAWLGRSPSFVAHVYMCSGKRPPLLCMLAWALSVSTAGKTQDSWMLSGVMCRARKWDNFIIRWAMRRFKKNLLKSKYGGNLGAVFAEYFRNGEHPLVAAWWGDFQYVSSSN